MKIYLLAAAIGMAFVYSGTSVAQVSIGALQDRHNSINAARHVPTYLGDNFNNFQISLMNPYASIGSNFASFRDARDLLQADRLSSSLIGTTLGDLRETNNSVAASLDLSILNVAVNIRNKAGRKLFSLGGGVNQRVEVSSSFNRELLLLAAYGNKQFAGQSVNIMPRFNGMAFTEWYLAGSATIAPLGSNLVIRPAARISYISAQAGIHMRRDNGLRMFTEQDGRGLDFDLNYRIDAAVGVDSLRLDGSAFNVNEKSLRAGSGSGFGMDLAVRISPMAGLSFNIGMMDIGSITFQKRVTNMYNSSSYRYEGAEIDFRGASSLDLDSLASLARPNYSYDPFRMTLPTKLVLSGSYGIKPHGTASNMWYTHQLNILYLQGFSNYLSSTSRPLLSVGYTYSLKNVLNLGVNAGVGGVYGGSIGALASVKAGPLRFGINSNNVLSLLAPSAGRGTDAGVLLALAF